VRRIGILLPVAADDAEFQTVSVLLLTDTNARLGADVDRYSFIAVDLHHLLLAGLPAHFESYMPSQPVRSLGGMSWSTRILATFPRVNETLTVRLPGWRTILVEATNSPSELGGSMSGLGDGPN
jgi:hypothetical protein